MLTLPQFVERADSTILAQLSDATGDALDEAKIQLALTDAAGVIEGYLFRLPAADRPPDTTIDAHHMAIALYVLASGRPGVEFESLARRYKKSIEYLESLSANSAGGGPGAAESPTPLFGDGDLHQFGRDR
jgi:phage gp36-like protein